MAVASSKHMDEPREPAPDRVLARAPQGNGLAVASLVLGIIGAALGLVPLAAPFALICGILGVILGFIGKERSRSAGAPYGGAARAGFVLGIVAIAFAILTIILVQIDVY